MSLKFRRIPEMKSVRFLAIPALLLFCSVTTAAPQIRGEYLESRTCDTYTGPCFANGEMNLAGKEAVMAWKVEKGSWNKVPLDGLGVALILTADNTLGFDGTFKMLAKDIKSVLLVDEKATPEQQKALIAFVKDNTKNLNHKILQVKTSPIELKNNHLDGIGVFKAGKLAKIETRALKDDDCVCTNEYIYYKPLGNVKDYSPAFAKTVSFQGEGLDNKWTNHGLRSGFLATFRH